MKINQREKIQFKVLFNFIISNSIFTFFFQNWENFCYLICENENYEELKIKWSQIYEKFNIQKKVTTIVLKNILSVELKYNCNNVIKWN